MNVYNLWLQSVGLAALATLSVTPLEAQTTDWINGGNDSLWTDSANWDNGSPATIGSTAVVQIENQPTNNTIALDTEAITNTIASLTFSPLTAGMTMRSADGIETLTVNGPITNSSNQTINLTLSMLAGASATYAGGATGGSLNFGTSLDLQGNAVTMTGTVNVTGDLIDSVGGGTLTIGNAQPGTVALTGNNTAYAGTTTITMGTLQAGSDSALGMGSVINGGTLEAVGIQHVINVGANYTQNAAGTLALNLNAAPDPVTGLNAANDVLNVTNTATLNGTLSLNFKFFPAQGQTFEVVETGTGITGNFSTVAVSPAIIILSTSESADDYFVTVQSIQLNLNNIPGISLTPNEMRIASYLNNPNLANTNPALFSAFLNILNNPSAVETALNEMSPEKFANFVRSNTFNNASFTTQLFDSYFESQRSATGDFLPSKGPIDASGLTVIDPTMDPALAQVSSRLLAWSPTPLGHGLLSDTSDPVMTDSYMGDTRPTTAPKTSYDYNIFVAGDAVLAENYSQTDLPHSNTTSGAMQIGVDYKITPQLRVGAIFGYTHSEANLDGNGSKATEDSYAPGGFVSFADNGWYANALASYAFNTFTEDRDVSIGSASAIAHGEPDGDQFTGDFDGGYDFHVKKWTFGPLAGVQYTHLDVKSYTENGAETFGDNMTVDKQKADSLRSRLGGHVSYVFQTGDVLLTPHLDVFWQHEFMDQSQGISAQIANVSGAPFTVTTPNASPDSALLDCGLNADLNDRVSIFGYYLVQAGQANYLGQSVQAGVKIGLE